jgi:hypothetical protein
MEIPVQSYLLRGTLLRDTIPIYSGRYLRPLVLRSFRCAGVSGRLHRAALQSRRRT